MTTPAADVPAPGELDLDTGAVGALEPAADAVAEPVAAAEPAVDHAGAEPAPATRKPTMLDELIEHRTVRAELSRERQQNEPVLSRLTPELRQAIVEGRVLVKPVATTTDARKEQLTQRAERLRLYTQDAGGNQIPDLDAAARVEAEIRGVAEEVVQPFRDMTLTQQAQHNLDVAVAFAEANGYDVDTVRETFQSASPAMVANPDLAKVLWTQAMGRMVERGKLPTGKPVKEPAPAAVVTEPTGRRGSSAGITLSPALQAVYKNAGVDPTKSFTATHKVDFSGPIELE